MTDQPEIHLCPNCGDDHSSKIRNALPEMAVMEKADSWGADDNNDPEQFVSDALLYFSQMRVMATQDSYMARQEEEGVPVAQAMMHFSAMMLRVGYIIGIQTHESYRETVPVEIPEQFATAEEIQKFVEEKTEEINKWENHSHPSSLQEAIKAAADKLGLDLSELRVVELSEQAAEELAKDAPSASGGDDEKRPGFYL